MYVIKKQNKKQCIYFYYKTSLVNLSAKSLQSIFSFLEKKKGEIIQL